MLNLKKKILVRVMDVKENSQYKSGERCKGIYEPAVIYGKQ